MKYRATVAAWFSSFFEKPFVRAREKIPPQARAYAASALLDRGHGKPAQAHTGESGTGPVTVNLIEELHPVAQLRQLPRHVRPSVRYAPPAIVA
jgi:hypothetical protein